MWRLAGEARRDAEVVCGGDGIKAHQLRDLVKEDQRLERELHADSKVGEGLSDWRICQRNDHKVAKKFTARAGRLCVVLLEGW